MRGLPERLMRYGKTSGPAALALCSSEFQLLCLNEAIGQGVVPSCRDGLIVLAFATDRRAGGMRRTAERLGLPVTVVSLFPGRFRYYSGKARVVSLRRSARSLVRSDDPLTLYLGGYAREYVPFVQSLVKGNIGRLVLGDDGLGSPIYWDGLYSELLDLYERGMSRFEPNKLILHSFLSARRPHLRMESNGFDELKAAIVRPRERSAGASFAWVVGQPYVTYGVVSVDTYLEYLQRLGAAIHDRHPASELVYLPHPTERSADLPRLEQSGWTIQSPRIPIELHATEAAPPVAIGGFASTAMTTLPRILSGPLDVFVARTPIDSLASAYEDLLVELAALGEDANTVLIDCS